MEPSEVAASLRALADRARRNQPSRHDPEKFHVEKSCLAQDLVELAGRGQNRSRERGLASSIACLACPCNKTTLVFAWSAGVFAEDDLDRIFKTRVQPQPGTVTGEDKGLRDCTARWIYAATSGTGWLFEHRGAPSRTRWLTRRKTVT